MGRNFKGLLARDNRPPGENSPRSDDHTKLAATNDFEARTIQFQYDPCDEPRVFGAWAGLEQTPSRYIYVYEDEDGNTQCKCSEELQPKLIQMGHEKFREAFHEVCDVPDYSPEDMSLSTEEDEVREEVDDGTLDKPERYQTVRENQWEVFRGWYKHAFDRIQSLACKVIVKAWIAKIQPKKSRFYPYNGGAEAKAQGLEKNDSRRHELAVPPWWPKGGSVDVPHKEPDHLDKHQRLELCLHILTGMWGMQVGINDEPLCVRFLREATDEVELRIRRMKNGKRSWDMLGTLYTKREVEERFLSGGSRGRTTTSLTWYRISGRTNSDGHSKRPRKGRKLSHAINGAFSSTRSQDDDESDTSPSESWAGYEGDSPPAFTPVIPQDREEDLTQVWTSPLVDRPKASLHRANANQTPSHHPAKRFLHIVSPSHTLGSESLGSFTPIEMHRGTPYPPWDARDISAMPRGWHSDEQGMSKRDTTCTWLPPPLDMNSSTGGVSSTAAAPYQWRHSSAIHAGEDFPCKTSGYHMASTGQQFTFPSGLPHPFLGQEPHNT